MSVSASVWPLKDWAQQGLLLLYGGRNFQTSESLHLHPPLVYLRNSGGLNDCQLIVAPFYSKEKLADHSFKNSLYYVEHIL